uniref:Venom peptide Pp17a n=1 Tax=Pristhesancus plagipennis TaxID=1955184 RepID=A0A2K8JUE7_PRIPG|nr:venom peptide Pp17a [Pristhesancus plagipennis]
MQLKFLFIFAVIVLSALFTGVYSEETEKLEEIGGKPEIEPRCGKGGYKKGGYKKWGGKKWG